MRNLLLGTGWGRRGHRAATRCGGCAVCRSPVTVGRPSGEGVGRQVSEAPRPGCMCRGGRGGKWGAPAYPLWTSPAGHFSLSSGSPSPAGGEGQAGGPSEDRPGESAWRRQAASSISSLGSDADRSRVAPLRSASRRRRSRTRQCRLVRLRSRPATGARSASHREPRRVPPPSPRPRR